MFTKLEVALGTHDRCLPTNDTCLNFPSRVQQTTDISIATDPCLNFHSGVQQTTDIPTDQSDLCELL